ncbi:double-strand break repair helicase AddA [Phenylobacterium sp.]|uniref:double-strand break repair helicase AddA n=1 Tax=Phenylobacterium sp. TaxID=1871053 RepID=UPI00301DF823
MTPPLIAGDPQRVAADPARSAFVSANAGSGKTKTLIDRVARLLLVGAEPEKILCVTYTKAAAAEMQRRLFERLGGWCVADANELRRALADLEGQPPEAYGDEGLARARRLFASALETPGGLKIQTIHAFCEKLLRRFPLEAGVSPGFTVMDDAAAAVIAREARKGVARHALKAEGRIAEAYARMSVALDFLAFEGMFRAFEDRREPLARYFERVGGLEGAEAATWDACGFEGPADPEAIARDAAAAIDRPLWAEAARLLEASGKSLKEAQALRRVAGDPASNLDMALAALFTEGGRGTPAAWVARAAALKAAPQVQMALLSEQDRLAQARERVKSARVAADTLDALVLARAYLAAYALEKDARGALDFADLIEKTAELVRHAPLAAWVLYKLDGGIDHILLDEAQDTAPGQWAVLDALVDEFFAGEGRERPRPRNLFVVGDEKQSIYSFQGADPTLLKAKYERHRARAEMAGQPFERVELIASWRSTEAVLGYVDAVFASPETRDGVPPPPGAERVRHEAVRRGHPGCVDIWPLFEPPEAPPREAWTAPLDLEPEESANRRLAREIALEIQATVKRGDAVWDRGLKDQHGRPGDWRPARYGDVLILVRKRSALFQEILRALKRAGVPVAGADRLNLSEHIVFDDLLALARVCLFPDDDLTLAALLRSPFCRVSDESLYRLAHGRRGSLWAALQARAAEAPEGSGWAEALATVQAAMALSREAPPFEVFARMLGRNGARAEIVRRLGGEADDALDEFLNQALAAEGRGVLDLESLVADFAGLDIHVKREMEAVRNEVRVMTAHGAKGLEAPIVFLPETTAQGGGRDSPLMETDGGVFLWCGSKAGDGPASAAARERRAKAEADESWRLLYVALTRARDRLVLCGKLPGNRREENLKGWWGLLKPAFEAAEIAGQVREIPRMGRRFGHDPEVLGEGQVTRLPPSPLPAWSRLAADGEAFARYASPSDLGEGAAAPAASPLARAQGLGRFRRGDLIHRLLQLLPDLPPDRQPEAAAALLARESDLTDDQRREMAAAALGVLRDDRFAEVFGPGSRAEAPVAGGAAALPPGLAISGRIDRLVVLAERVLAVDFKTNRPSPPSIEAADPAYLRQMAMYAAVLAEVFPGRRVEAAIVWTDGPKLMPVPENLIAATLADLRRDG